MKASFWIVLALVLLGIAVSAVWTRNVEIRVPKGYRGLIRIKQDAAANPVRIGFCKIVIDVPRSGEIAIPSLNIFRRWHHDRAEFDDGSSLDVCFPGDSCPGITLQLMPAPTTFQVFFFVGKRDELTSYLEQNRDMLYSIRESGSGR